MVFVYFEVILGLKYSFVFIFKLLISVKLIHNDGHAHGTHSTHFTENETNGRHCCEVVLQIPHIQILLLQHFVFFRVGSAQQVVVSDHARVSALVVLDLVQVSTLCKLVSLTECNYRHSILAGQVSYH